MGDSSPGTLIRVLIADDHAMVRAGLRRILELEPDIRVVDEATDGMDAVEKACRAGVDVVLMDISMPRKNGMEATRALAERAPSVRVIALTIHTDDQYVVEMARAGAWGYVVKDEDPGGLVTAVRRVAAGQVYVSEGVVGSLLRALHERPHASWPPALKESVLDGASSLAAAVPEGEASIATAPSLTGREVEVLSLIARGQTNRQIAQALVLSEKTVKNHVTSILRKLHLKDRTQAAVWALRSGRVP